MKKAFFGTIIALLFGFPLLGWAQTDTGMASVYADSFAGKVTASGDKYDPNALTAAHRSLRFGTRLAVTNPSNGNTVTVRINDRGPWVQGRLLDLSSAAAKELGITGAAKISVRVLRADQPDVTHLSPVPPAAQAAAFVPTPGHQAYLQLGAFQGETSAAALARSLQKQGYQPEIRHGEKYYRVYLAVPQDQVRTMRTRLAKDGRQSYFVIAQEPKGTAVELPLTP